MSRWRTEKRIQTDPQSLGPKVLAAGLWRCATSSLQIAFETMLNPPLKPSMHGSYIFTSIPLLKLSVRVTSEIDTQKRQKLLSEIFTGYNASSDFPGMAFVDDLIQLYPDMELVLNKRHSAEAWEKSVKESLRFFSTWWYFGSVCLLPQGYWHWKLYREYHKLAKRRFGKRVDIWSAEYYEMHNKWVRRLARANGKQILEWEPAMGWSPLCEFLDMKMPDGEFPKTNELAEIKELKVLLVVKGIAIWLVVLVVLSYGWRSIIDKILSCQVITRD